MQSPVVEPLDDLDLPTTRTNPTARLVLFLTLGLCAVLGWRYLGPRSALAENGWIGDWDSAIGQTKSSGKPALVLFTADWCPACHELESNVLSQPDVAAFLRDNFTLVMVDLTDRNGPNAQRAREFGVRSIPTMIRYDASNQEIGRASIVSRPVLMAWLNAESKPQAGAGH